MKTIISELAISFSDEMYWCSCWCMKYCYC